MFTDAPILLLVHSDPWVRHELTQNILAWSHSSLDVIATASEHEAYNAIYGRPQTQELLAIVISDEKLIDDDGERFLQGIHKKFPGTSLALLTTRNDVSSDGIHRVTSSSISLREAIKPLYASWSPPNPSVTVTGPKESGKADELIDFLYRTATIYDWSDESGSEISVVIDERECENWTLEKLFKELHIFPEPKRQTSHQYDVVIVGAGPAGLSAALSASVNAGFSTLLIESHTPGGSAATSINPIDNYLGFPEGVSGLTLTNLAIRQVRDLGMVDFLPMLRAQWIRHDTAPHAHGRYLIGTVNGSTGENIEVSAGMVLLACGMRPHRLDLKIPQRGVYYAALPCDQHRERGKEVVVVGGGNSAGMAALQFATESKSVYVVAAKGFDLMSQRLQEEVERNRKIEVLPGYRVIRFGGNEQLTHVKVKNDEETTEKTRKIDAASAYILIGGRPDTKWLHPDARTQAMGAEKVDLTRGWCIKTDHFLRHHRGKLPFETSLPGVFAAGDVRVNALRRVGQAAGQGAAAIASMETYAAEHPRVLRDSTSPAYTRFSILRLSV
ncbi:FAD-dependent oxidoreductase [Streptomyces griseorubiginosus]|uniref:FAD-dependent oxidoreductase n=1 Tax=Streptomyces griseorubiginosus TaxID=67304 RepID=UPI000AE833B2|nr:FAD-dependent oxidoreductase [Streptomyces griseorubiginosus]